MLLYLTADSLQTSDFTMKKNLDSQLLPRKLFYASLVRFDNAPDKLPGPTSPLATMQPYGKTSY